MIVALAGGVGGAKLAHGLYGVARARRVNRRRQYGDDFDLYGLRISPDADTVLYTLAGIANPDTGWGVAGDTFTTLEMLRRYGEDTWFLLGDRDFATHILRTSLAARWGQTPTRVPGASSPRASRCAQPAAADVRRAGGNHRADARKANWRFRTTSCGGIISDAVRGCSFRRDRAGAVPGHWFATPSSRRMRLSSAPRIPSSASGRFWRVPGMRDLVRAARAPKVAVSPIVGRQGVARPSGSHAERPGI